MLCRESVNCFFTEFYLRVMLGPILFFLFPEGDSGFLTDFSDWQKPQAICETVRSSMSP